MSEHVWPLPLIYAILSYMTHAHELWRCDGQNAKTLALAVVFPDKF